LQVQKVTKKTKHFAIFDIFGKTKSEIFDVLAQKHFAIFDIKRENGVQYLPFYMTMIL